MTWRSTCCTGWSDSMHRRGVHVPVTRRSLKEADRGWALLEAARESLLTAVAHSGATRIEYTAGFSEDELLGLSTVAQSQETVDRDDKGIWLDATG